MCKNFLKSARSERTHSLGKTDPQNEKEFFFKCNLVKIKGYIVLNMGKFLYARLIRTYTQKPKRKHLFNNKTGTKCVFECTLMRLISPT